MALTGTGIWLSTAVSWPVWLGGQLVLAAALVQWFVLLHECGHGTLFATRRLNVVVGQVAGFFALIPFDVWKRIHGRHHRWTGWQDVDPTTAALAPRPLTRLERIIVNVCWRCWVPLFSTLYRLNNFWNVPRLRRLFPDGHVFRKLVVSGATVLTLYAIVIAALGAGPALRLFGIALVAALIVEDVLIVSQHTHIPMGLSHGRDVTPHPAITQAPFTRSLRLPAWISRFVLHFDAHELHHMYPFVPGYRLDDVPYRPGNEVHWLRWIPAARAVRGDVLFFQNRDDTGFDL
jgi:acyl-lipid omega-6 desaturase (Delta-12 desaturase)